MKKLGNNELLLLKERETFKNICNKRLNKIVDIQKEYYDEFKLIVNNTGIKTDFNERKYSVAFLIVLKNMKYR